MKRTFLIACILLIPVLTKADEPRTTNSFVSENSRFEFKYVSGQFTKQRWVLIDRETRQVRYELVGEILSRTVLVSNDGIYLVVIDDFSEATPKEDHEVLAFYQNGKLTRHYVLKEMLSNTQNIRRSVSHFMWLTPAVQPALKNDRVILKTLELVVYEFDIITGEIRSKQALAK